MTSAGCHIRQCDHGFYLSIKSTANIAIIFDLKQFSTKNFSFLTFLSQRALLPYTKTCRQQRTQQVLWECMSIRVYFCKASITHHDFPKISG